MKNLKFYLFFLAFMMLFFKEEIKNATFYAKPSRVEVIKPDSLISENTPLLPINFCTVYESFKSYNPTIDSSSAIKFAEVADHFGISEDHETFKWVIAQILLESGAQHYYRSQHPKEGKLVISSAGAIGMCQIVPGTAYGYMVNKIPQEDMDCFIEMGGTDFSFAYNDKLSKKQKINMAKTWLQNETNNILMWGKIMSCHLEAYDIEHALISYNAGPRGLKRFLKVKTEKKKHEYIKGIESRLKYVKS